MPSQIGRIAYTSKKADSMPDSLIPREANFDTDILFNEGNWADAIRSQTKLFSFDGLSRISDGLRHDFYMGHAVGREMPEFAQSEWATDLLAPYDDRPLGYDLPCLLSQDRPAKGRVMLCAQDPLRKNGTPGHVSVGTFFGIDNPHYRHKYRHYPILWKIILSCVSSGYDVWLAFAAKVGSEPKLTAFLNAVKVG